MEILNIEAHLSAYILLVGGIALAAVAFRYFRERDSIFWDASTYFVLLMCLYVGVPAFVHLETGITSLGATYETIQFAASYSLYFMFVVTAYYLFKALLSPAPRNHGSHGIGKPITLFPISSNVIYVLYALIVAYVLIVFFLNSPGIQQLWSDRAVASLFSGALNDTYKIQLMFAIAVSLVVYLTLRNARNRYLFMFLPFVALNLMTAGRDLLYQSLMASIGILLLTKTRIPVFSVAVVALLVVSIEVVRFTWDRPFDLSNYLIVPGELSNTAEAGYLLIESQRAVDILDLLIYSLGKIFTPQVMTALFGGVVNFRDIITAESQLDFGLGGSLLAEVFSVKNYFLYVLYPFIAIVYLEIINLLRSRAAYFGISVFIFYLISTHAIFRGGVIFASMEPLYYALYAGSWYWIIKVLFAGRVRHSYASLSTSA